MAQKLVKVLMTALATIVFCLGGHWAWLVCCRGLMAQPPQRTKAESMRRRYRRLNQAPAAEPRLHTPMPTLMACTQSRLPQLSSLTLLPTATLSLHATTLYHWRLPLCLHACGFVWSRGLWAQAQKHLTIGGKTLLKSYHVLPLTSVMRVQAAENRAQSSIHSCVSS